MGYHVVDPSTLDPFPDREAEPRSVSQAAGLPKRGAKLGLRTYTASPGEQLPAMYHYHDEQVEAFYVLSGTLQVETPEGEYAVDADQALFVDPGSPQRAHNPEDADSSVRFLAIGAPSVDDAHVYEPEQD